jgi:hypothetical protein
MPSTMHSPLFHGYVDLEVAATAMVWCSARAVVAEQCMSAQPLVWRSHGPVAEKSTTRFSNIACSPLTAVAASSYPHTRDRCSGGGGSHHPWQDYDRHDGGAMVTEVIVNPAETTMVGSGVSTSGLAGDGCLSGRASLAAVCPEIN